MLLHIAQRKIEKVTNDTEKSSKTTIIEKNRVTSLNVAAYP